MEPIINDKRFSHIVNDARFRAVPHYHRKVKIDRRFNDMFTKDLFRSKGTVDKRGRPQTYDTKQDMKKFYDLSSEESESDSDDDDDNRKNEDQDVKKSNQKKVKGLAPTNDVAGNDSSDNEPPSGDDSEQNILEEQRSENSDSDLDSSKAGCSKTKTSAKTKILSKKKAIRKTDASSSSDDNTDSSSEEDDTRGPKSRVDYARGRADIETSSSDESSSDEDGETLIQPWGELDKDAPRDDQTSHRLAICNIDWDEISARDLYMLLGSFVPTGGMIKSVKIYLSEFGKERLAEEDLKGPKELVEGAEVVCQKDKHGEEMENEQLVMERMRLYQINRLKYYYAVAEFDSAETAVKVYEDCDGFEYEMSSCRFDVRFIPDDMTFDEEPHSFADQGFKLGKFKPKEFSLTALQHQTVDVTWDQTDPSRVAMIQRVFNKEDEEKLDLQVYLASSSDGEGASDKEVAIRRRKNKKSSPAASIGSPSDSANDSDSSSQQSKEKGGKGKQSDGISKYRSLLQDLEKETKKKEDRGVELEITWNTGLSEKSHPLIQKILDKKEELSPWEQFLERKKQKKKLLKKGNESKDQNKNENNSDNPYSDDDLPEGVDLENDPFFKDNAIKKSPQKQQERTESKKKKNNKPKEETEEDKAKRAQLELLLLDDKDDNKNHFSLTKLVKKEKKKWGKKKKANDDDKDLDDFKVDVSDPRFSAIYESHLFSIDPSQPQFKKTKAMEALIQEKQNRRKIDDSADENSPAAKKGKIEPTTNANREKELSVLIKSVKNKASNYKSQKKEKKKVS